MSKFGFKDAILPRLSALNESFAENDIETELKQLTLEIFKDYLAEKFFDVNVLGNAHTGSFDLIRKTINYDGLVLLNGDGEEEATRYIYRAWKAKNQQGRGVHFLKTYLQMLFPNICEIQQLWQRTNMPYPDPAGDAWDADGNLITDTLYDESYFYSGIREDGTQWSDNYHHIGELFLKVDGTWKVGGDLTENQRNNNTTWTWNLPHLGEEFLKLDGTWKVGGRLTQIVDINGVVVSDEKNRFKQKVDTVKKFLTSRLLIKAEFNDKNLKIRKIKSILNSILPARLIPNIIFWIKNLFNYFDEYKSKMYFLINKKMDVTYAYENSNFKLLLGDWWHFKWNFWRKTKLPFNYHTWTNDDFKLRIDGRWKLPRDYQHNQAIAAEYKEYFGIDFKYVIGASATRKPFHHFMGTVHLSDGFKRGYYFLEFNKHTISDKNACEGIGYHKIKLLPDNLKKRELKLDGSWKISHNNNKSKIQNLLENPYIAKLDGTWKLYSNQQNATNIKIQNKEIYGTAFTYTIPCYQKPPTIRKKGKGLIRFCEEKRMKTLKLDGTWKIYADQQHADDMKAFYAKYFNIDFSFRLAGIERPKIKINHHIAPLQIAKQDNNKNPKSIYENSWKIGEALPVTFRMYKTKNVYKNKENSF